MPWAGYPRPIAPRLEELHRRAVDYPHAYAVSSFTSKSLAALTSGRYPSELARTGVFFTQYLKSNDMFCESLAEAGVPCVAGMAHGYLAKGYAGFDQGFRDWRLVPGITFDYNTDPYVTSDKLTPLAISMLSDASLTRAPFFAWFHYMDPHDKYQSHSPHPGGPAPDGGAPFGARPRDLYDEEVLYTSMVGSESSSRLRRRSNLGRAHRHHRIRGPRRGASGEHHEYAPRSRALRRARPRPALLRASPATRKRARSTCPAVKSTSCRRSSSSSGRHPARRSGVALVPELLGAAPAPPRDIVCDLPRDDWNERRRALLHEGLKLIAFGDDVRFELYDLRADPGEQTDLYWKRRDLADDMLRRYHEASRGIEDIAPAGGIPTHDAGPAAQTIK